ncbi:MAG TPA: pilus assembly protein PilA, partial [Thermoleophilia bacterium]|nr:pilus assembly protein PilA [Thermoleophilia bacterium]
MPPAPLDFPVAAPSSSSPPRSSRHTAARKNGTAAAVYLAVGLGGALAFLLAAMLARRERA